MYLVGTEYGRRVHKEHRAFVMRDRERGKEIWAIVGTFFGIIYFICSELQYPGISIYNGGKLNLQIGHASLIFIH
jgi:hypothetical protein